jgi:flagellin
MRSLYYVQNSNKKMQETMEKLASGSRINHASDDAAGLAISTRFSTQIKGNDASIKNIEDALSLVNRADGSLHIMSDQLQRMRELALQAKNGTYNQQDIAFLQREFSELSTSINQTAATTTFNGISLLNADVGMSFNGQNSRVIADLGTDWKASDGTASQSTWTVETTLKVNQWDSQTFTHPLSIGSGHNLTFYVNNSVKGLVFKGYINNVRYEYTIASNIQLNKDYHVTASYDGSKLRVYVNGASKITANASGEVNVNDGKVIIGDTSVNGTTNTWNGIVKDVRVYNQALNGNDILQNYNGNVKREGLIGEWLLNEGSNEPIKDTSGNTNEGTIKGNTSWKGNLSIHTGYSSDDMLSIGLSRVSLKDLGINGMSLTDSESIDKIDHALTVITNERMKYGQTMTTLQTKKENLYASNENIITARSRMNDADVAEEMSELTKEKILSQSALSVLVQSSSLPEKMLDLLK